jgi:hypothetical protein
MRVFDDTAKLLDANYSIEPDGTRLALIMDSRSGRSRTTGRETNRDYNIGLQRLLERLGGLDATLVDGFVDSDTTRRLGIPEAERRIVDRAKPVRLADVADMEKFRQELGTAQSKVAQSPTSTRPGNATRRIRLLFDVPGFEAGQASRLGDILAAPGRDSQRDRRSVTTQVILQPSNARNYALTVGNPVSFADYTDLIQPQLSALEARFPAGTAPMWGLKAGRGSNLTQYRKVSVGDVMMFGGGGRFFAAATVAYLMQNDRLADALWGSDPDGETWEYMYVLEDVRPLDVPYAEVNRIVGYARMPRNVIVLDEAKSRAVLDRLGLEPPASNPPRLGSPYRQAEVREGAGARDPFSTDSALIERGLRGHADTQNELAEVLREAGIEPLSPKPGEPNYDLAWQAQDATCVAEVKSITNVNEDLQLRLGLGQVLWYRHRLAGVGYDNVIAVLVPERAPRDTAWEQLCNKLGVVLLSGGELERAPLVGLRTDEDS